MRSTIALCAASVLSAALASSQPSHAQTPGPASPPPAPAAGNDPRQTQLSIANAKFNEALAAAREAHRLMPIAVEKSVIYEETKANRKNPSCEEALAAAKTESSRARKAFNEARGKAKTSFEAAKRAVQELKRLGPDPAGASPVDSLPFAADIEAIEACMKMLEHKMWKRINSSLTRRTRGLLWLDTQEYAKNLPKSWAQAEASSLVPDDVTVPCLGSRIPLHVQPEE